MATGARKAKKEATNRRILDAAYEVYTKQGFGAPSVAIARAAGVSHGAVFAHFNTVEALQTALLARFGDELSARLDALTARAGSLRELLQVHVYGLAAYEDFYARLVSEAALLPEAARMGLLKIQGGISQHFDEAHRREVAAGTARDLPLTLLFNTWMGLVNYYVLNGELYAPGQSVLRAKGAELVDGFMELVASR